MPFGDLAERVLGGAGKHGVRIHDQLLKCLESSLVLRRRNFPQRLSGCNAHVGVGVVGEEGDQFVDVGELMLGSELSGDFANLPDLIV